VIRQTKLITSVQRSAGFASQFAKLHFS